jgi:L-histidine Nalpha-methyltransferase
MRSDEAVIASRDPARIREEILEGLTARPRRLPSRFFYDERGARLFQEITRLEEYYLTDAEVEILGRRAAAVARVLGPRTRMVEYGSGSGEKTWIVLDALEEPAAYVPVDVSRAQLLEFARRVRDRFPDLEVLPVRRTSPASRRCPGPRRRPGAPSPSSPGSTVGNLEPKDAEGFLARIGKLAGPGSYLLIGADLVKDLETLERAYDDPRGVTAEFNRNILRHLNRLLGSDFEPDAFGHRALWNGEESRIEMHLVSLRDQVVRLGPGGAGEEADGAAPSVRIPEGEFIVTEHSYKYELPEFATLAGRAGYEPVEAWTDGGGRFSVHLLRFPHEPPGP